MSFPLHRYNAVCSLADLVVVDDVTGELPLGAGSGGDGRQRATHRLFGALAFCLSTTSVGSHVRDSTTPPHPMQGKRQREEEDSSLLLISLDEDDDNDDNDEEDPRREGRHIAAPTPPPPPPRARKCMYVVGAPVSAAHMRRLFLANRQRQMLSPHLHTAAAPHSEEEEGLSRPMITTTTTTTLTVATTAAAACDSVVVGGMAGSRADWEALSWLFPALHAGVLYDTAETFVRHCQRSQEHLITCEDLPLFPISQKKRTGHAAAGEDREGVRRPRRAACTGNGEGSRMEPTMEELSPGFLAWFTLLHDALTRELSRSLPARTRTSSEEEEEGEGKGSRLAAAVVIPYFSFWLAAPLANRLSCADSSASASASAAAVPGPLTTATMTGEEMQKGERQDGGRPRQEAAAQASEAPKSHAGDTASCVDWSSLWDAAREMSMVLCAEWTRLWHSALARESVDRRHLTLGMLLLPDNNAPGTVRRRWGVSSAPPPVPPPPLLLQSLVLPLASKVVTRVRRRERHARLAALQRAIHTASSLTPQQQQRQGSTGCEAAEQTSGGGWCQEEADEAAATASSPPVVPLATTRLPPTPCPPAAGEQQSDPEIFVKCVNLVTLLLLNDPSY